MVSVGMVSAKGTKRRIQKRRMSQKRRRPQKRRRLQHGSRCRSLSRKSVAKKRKTSDQGKHRPMKRRRASKRSLPFDAKKLKGAKGSERFLSRKAKGLMITIVEDIYKQVSSEVERLRRESRKAMISPMHVQAALQTVMPKRKLKRAAFRNRH